MSALDLLSGDAQTFIDKVWASSLHIHQADPDALTGLFSLADADHLLTETAIRTPAIRLAKDGTVLPESTYTRGGATIAGKALTGLLDPRKTLDLFRDGATIVFQGLHRYWPPLTRLIAELEAELGHPCQVNAYLTPPGSQGFAVHSDTHDVFVFQTAGSKLWELHPPEGRTDLTLTPGTCVYLPTGTPHAARAQDTVSLHVTVGINQLTWRGLVQRSIADAVAQTPDAHLPAGFLDDPASLAAGLADELRALADRITQVDAHQAAEQEVRRVRTSRRSDLAGGLFDALVEVTDDTGFELRQPMLWQDDGDRIEILLRDRTLAVPARLRPALEAIASRTTLTPRDLAEHLDPQSRLVLVRRLLREGLLRSQ